MTVNEQIAILMENRLMTTHEQYMAFDNALTTELPEPTEEEVLRLFLVFDDATDDHEVMFGLIHYVEHVFLRHPIEVYVQAVATALPAMNVRASDWAGILVTRILNDQPSRAALVECATKTAGVGEHAALRQILQLLTGHSDRLAAAARALLLALPD